jgi:hypothetical protein
MARTQIKLPKQAKGHSLVLGEATEGEVSRLTLNLGTGDTSTTVLDAKGLISVAGFSINPIGGVDGQQMVISNGSLIPKTIVKDVESLIAPAEPLINTFFLLKDESKALVSGVYEMATNWDGTIYADVPDEYETNVISLSKFRIFDSQFVGKKVYYNLGGYLHPLEMLSDVSTRYEHFFENGEGFFDQSKSSVISSALLSGNSNANTLFVIDEQNSPSYELGKTFYSVYDDVVKLKKIPLGAYNAEFEGKPVFWPMWGGIQSAFVNGYWWFEYEGVGYTPNYSERPYNDYIVDGVFNPYIEDIRTNYQHNEFWSVRENNTLSYNHNTLMMKDSFEYIKPTSANTISFTSKNNNLEKDTVYVDNIDVTGDLIVKGSTILDGVGLGGYSWVSSSMCDANGLGSFAGGEGNTVHSDYGTAFGSSATVSGYCGFAAGQYNVVKGDYGTAFGRSNQAGEYAMALGQNSRAEGESSFAGGIGTYSHYDGNKGMSVYASPKAVGKGSFNFSTVTQSGVTGAAADHSVVLGGINNEVLSTATNSVVLGGSGLTATKPNTVYVPNLVITGTINTPVTKAVSIIGEVNNSNLIFTYAENIVADSIMIYLNGLIQSYQTGADYSVDYVNKTITFNYAPYTSDSILIYGSVMPSE